MLAVRRCQHQLLHLRRVLTLLCLSAVNMDISQCTRKTVNEDPEALPSIQIYIDSRSQVWHDLDYVFQYLRPLKIATRMDNFVRDCTKFWNKSHVPDGHRFLRTAAIRATAAINACSTFALYIILWSQIAFGRHPAATEQKLLSIFSCICISICTVIHHCPCISAGLSPFPSFPHMRVGDGGRTVSGIWQAIQQLPRKAIACLQSAWRRLYDKNKVVYASMEQDWLTI